ncbi:hypothetical protein [Nocardia nova]|nr:hypothetical protein [Nocardia nova]
MAPEALMLTRDNLADVIDAKVLMRCHGDAVAENGERQRFSA